MTILRQLVIELWGCRGEEIRHAALPVFMENVLGAV
jgi:hypothetical protein